MSCWVQIQSTDVVRLYLSRGRVFARTHSHEATQPWFSAVKALASSIASTVPPNLALFGENMEAVHSIEYDGLTAPFHLHGALDVAQDEWCSWDEVVALACILGISTVPVLFEGCFEQLNDIKAWMDEQVQLHYHLGYWLFLQPCYCCTPSNLLFDALDSCCLPGTFNS